MSKFARVFLALDILLLATVASWILFTSWAVATGPTMANGAAALAQAFPPSARFSPPEGVDLDITYINRTPLYKAYCVQYPWNVPDQPCILLWCAAPCRDPGEPGCRL